MRERVQKAIIHPLSGLLRRRPVCGDAVSGIPIQSDIALCRIKVGPVVHETSVTRARHADSDAALASSALSVAGGEVDGIDPAIASHGGATLGAELGSGSPDPGAVGAGVTVP